jgi:hypothetical protein
MCTSATRRRRRRSHRGSSSQQLQLAARICCYRRSSSYSSTKAAAALLMRRRLESRKPPLVAHRPGPHRSEAAPCGWRRRPRVDLRVRRSGVRTARELQPRRRVRRAASAAGNAGARTGTRGRANKRCAHRERARPRRDRAVTVRLPLPAGRQPRNRPSSRGGACPSRRTAAGRPGGHGEACSRVCGCEGRGRLPAAWWPTPPSAPGPGRACPGAPGSPGISRHPRCMRLGGQVLRVSDGVLRRAAPPRRLCRGA